MIQTALAPISGRLYVLKAKITPKPKLITNVKITLGRFNHARVCSIKASCSKIVRLGRYLAIPKPIKTALKAPITVIKYGTNECFGIAVYEPVALIGLVKKL